MTDREKVLTGLECLLTNEISCPDCPYDTAGYCVTAIAKDALELLKDDETQLQYRDDHIAMYQAEIKRLEAMLKEHEPKPVEYTNAYGTKFYFCPKCKRELFHTRNLNFCERCGQAVKWE